MSETLNLGNFTVHGVTPDQAAILRGRDAFIEAYCEQRGWSRLDLTLDQVFEIRQQEGWRTPK